MALRPEDSWAPHSLQLYPQFRPHSDDGGQNQQRQAGRQQHLPSYFHELVKAVTGERATIPDIEVHERGNFRGEPENVGDPYAYSWDEQNQADQAENHPEPSQPDGLYAEQRMLRHPRRVVETDRRQEKKRNSGEQGEDQIPRRAGQRVWKRTQPSAQPQRDRDRRNRNHRRVFGQKE